MAGQTAERIIRQGVRDARGIGVRGDIAVGIVGVTCATPLKAGFRDLQATSQSNRLRALNTSKIQIAPPMTTPA